MIDTRHQISLSLALATSLAWAAPGAHGPGGEHLDAPATAGARAAAPRIEARSEDFELVGLLQGGELSILINRFETNDPVLGAVVEVESGNLKAKAPFHGDHGDYAVADEAFVKAVSRPGAHPIVVTVTAGKDADLLEGTLNVPAADSGPATAAISWRTGAAAAIAALFAAAGAWALWRRRRTGTGSPQGRSA